MKLESTFKTELKKELKDRYQGCIVTYLDPCDIQGIPDILILYKNRWATLEVKRHANASRQPNQKYYVKLMNDMSYSNIIYPENCDIILNDLDIFFK